MIDKDKWMYFWVLNQIQMELKYGKRNQLYLIIQVETFKFYKMENGVKRHYTNF
jgi:hypothetical protein